MAAGLIGRSVVVDWDDPHVVDARPHEVAVGVITMAELASGPHLATDPFEPARRQAVPG
ncbi:MAG: twitching motility protein PilT [Acidimicrobiales bacterium]